MQYRITYLGEGVVANKLGVFQNGTTARTDDEQLANELSTRTDLWRVADKDGTLLGAQKVQAAQVQASQPVETLTSSDGAREHSGKKNRWKDQAAENSQGG